MKADHSLRFEILGITHSKPLFTGPHNYICPRIIKVKKYSLTYDPE